MTQDELARMPEGGAKWEELHPDSSTVLLMIGDGSVYRVLKPDARQIVGSVNAAILAPYVESLLHSHGAYNYNKAKSDYDFWLNYAKGNA